MGLEKSIFGINNKYSCNATTLLIKPFLGLEGNYEFFNQHCRIGI